MSLSFYKIAIPTYLQTLGAVVGYLERGRAHFQEKGVDVEEFMQTRLAPDMLPFAFQIGSIAQHSRGAVDAILSGRFVPPSKSPKTYAEAQALVAEAKAGIEAVTEDAFNARLGQEVIFDLGERKLPFVAEDFLTTFSIPNFYFHSATAYDILRWKGVPIGKRDFLGRMRMKT